MKRLLALLTAFLLCVTAFAALAEQNESVENNEVTTIPFGRYPQTADGTDSAPIEWILLDYREEEGRALLLSKYVLDAAPFNNQQALITWEECTLRSWLNNEFLNTAFNDEELSYILSSTLPNGQDQQYRAMFASGGPDTEDRVFLLSYAEARNCLGVTGDTALENTYSRTYATEYALAKGVQQKKYNWDGETVPWWLRSSGKLSNVTSVVEGDGSVGEHSVEADNMGVRPAIWINTDPEGNREEYDRQKKVLEFKTVGNVVKYGHYEQDNDRNNGKEEIEWIVLDVKDNRVLLLSFLGLDSRPYLDEESVHQDTWENSTLRTWLQEKFLPEAFTKEERAAIVKTKVSNSKKQGNSFWKTDGGNNTKEKIFLLSYAEAKKYQEIIWEDTYNTKAGVILSTYARKQGAKQSDWCYIDKQPIMIYPGWWWLRSPGEKQNRAAIVDCDGELRDKYTDSEGGAIRPAFWLDLDKAPF